MGAPRHLISEMALIFPQDQFQHILRVLNTNVDGRHKVPFAITSIKGVGRRFANMVCKKAEIDLNKRAGDSPAKRSTKWWLSSRTHSPSCHHGSSTGRRTSRMVRLPTCMPIFWTPRCASPSSASGSAGLTVVSVTVGACVCVVRRHAPLAVTVRLSVSPVRRDSKLFQCELRGVNDGAD